MSKQTPYLKLLAVGCLLLFGARSIASQGQATNSGAEDKPSGPAERSNSAGSSSGIAGHQAGWRYTVEPSDTLELTFMLTPDFDQTVTVQPDGYITLRGAGDLLAVGKTLPQLMNAIKEAYSQVLHDPVISIDPKDFEKPYFLVGGQVGKPGKFDWRGRLTLTQAITIAGGFTDNAKHSQVLLFRRVSDDWAETKVINVKQMLRAKDLQEDIVLQPGDMVYVPKNAISKIKPYIPVPTLGLYSNQF